MIDRTPKFIRCYDDLFALLKLTNASSLNSYPMGRQFPDFIFSESCLFVAADIFEKDQSGLRQASHGVARGGMLLSILLACEWVPGDNSETSWKSPLMQLAFEAPDDKEM